MRSNPILDERLGDFASTENGWTFSDVKVLARGEIGLSTG
jgi:hypothetical protein